MATRDEVEAVLDRVRPYLRADQGDIELVDLVENDAIVRLTGACASCPSARVTLVWGIEAALRACVQGFERVRQA